ncbi:MAG: ribose 5-phosphate isomerase B [Candidatus Omnitrophota bacterium]|nr:ribose 5-phosphate isomerase B [Candidatus Omnitrophota bacterium]
MRIVIGSDHGGYELKNKIIKFLKSEKYAVEDFGTHSKESCDYPLIGFDVAQAVSKGKADKGILICRSGVGMAIIANKLHGIRAAACYDRAMARSSREHNDCNILVLAADYTKFREAKELVKIWLSTKHIGQRHARRVKQIRQIESRLKGKIR